MRDVAAPFRRASIRTPRGAHVPKYAPLQCSERPRYRAGLSPVNVINGQTIDPLRFQRAQDFVGDLLHEAFCFAVE
jgi:hypothetical protein